MSHYYYHCISSAKRYGGEAVDYIQVHRWMDRGRRSTNKILHRMLAHHTQGIMDAIERFGDTIMINTGRQVPVSLIVEQHIQEDLGFIPTLDHYIELLHCPRWASRPARLLFSKLMDEKDHQSDEYVSIDTDLSLIKHEIHATMHS